MSVTNRQRSIPPSMFADEVLLELPAPVRLTGLGLRFYVDDEGRGSANPALIKGQLWPLHPQISEEVIDEHLVTLDDVGYIQLYSVDGRTLLAFDEWPKTDRGAPSRLPAPPPRPALATSSRDPREDLAVVEERERGRGGGRKSGEGGVGEEAPALPTQEPSPFCSKHQPYGTERPCGGCAAARTKHRLWLRDQTDDAARDLDERDGER